MLGNTDKFVGAQFFKPYVKTNKNDMPDSEASCEAVTRSTMAFVPIKAAQQADIQGLNRSQSHLMTTRTAVINQIRGLLEEQGMIIPKSSEKVCPLLIRFLDAQNTLLTQFAKESFSKQFDELVDRGLKIEKIQQRLKRFFKTPLVY